MNWITRWWDWIDSRDIDKHALSIAVMWGTVRITEWAMGYANAHPDPNGVGNAAVIAAVSAPYMALQAAAIKFYFDSRTS